jgi:MoxR-like ATPase
VHTPGCATLATGWVRWVDERTMRDMDHAAGTGDLATALAEQLGGVLIGDPAPVRLAVAAFLAGGHVLLEDMPGVGKTLLAKALARSLGGSFGRVQGTPDLLPSDLTGVSVYDDQRHDWVFHPGPLFRHVVLVDELNRATPRTQSALLEAMAERQVTVDGTGYAMEEPFLVVATQNPHGDPGTFPLVQGQRDRFAVSLSLGLPDRRAELAVVTGRGGEHALERLAPLAAPAAWQAARRTVAALHTHEAVATYALDVMDAVRAEATGHHPLSTRASLQLLAVARGHAVLAGRDHLQPDDVRAVAGAVLAHRIVDSTGDDLPAARHLVADAAAKVRVPPGAG